MGLNYLREIIVVFTKKLNKFVSNIEIGHTLTNTKENWDIGIHLLYGYTCTVKKTLMIHNFKHSYKLNKLHCIPYALKIQEGIIAFTVRFVIIYGTTVYRGLSLLRTLSNTLGTFPNRPN